MNSRGLIGFFRFLYSLKILKILTSWVGSCLLDCFIWIRWWMLKLECPIPYANGDVLFCRRWKPEEQLSSAFFSSSSLFLLFGCRENWWKWRRIQSWWARSLWVWFRFSTSKFFLFCNCFIGSWVFSRSRSSAIRFNWITALSPLLCVGVLDFGFRIQGYLLPTLPRRIVGWKRRRPRRYWFPIKSMDFSTKRKIPIALLSIWKASLMASIKIQPQIQESQWVFLSLSVQLSHQSISSIPVQKKGHLRLF